MQEYMNMYNEDFPHVYIIFLVNEKGLDLLSHILVICAFKKTDPLVGWHDIFYFYSSKELKI